MFHLCAPFGGVQFMLGSTAQVEVQGAECRGTIWHGDGFQGTLAWGAEVEKLAKAAEQARVESGPT